MTEPGASRTPPRRWWRRRGVALAVAVTILVLAGAALAGVWRVSASPQFCNSCHIMRPYVEAWRVSKHSGVACVQCHYPPGFRDTLWVKFQAVTQVAKWATRTYSSKPYAEVEDASCFRSGCHSGAQLGATGTRTSGRGIKFDHRPHLDAGTMGRQLRCTNCHSQIVVAKHFEVDHSACFVCHFKGTKSGRALTPIAGCTGCHEPPRGDILVSSVKFNHEQMVRRGVACETCHLNVVEGEGEVRRERCYTCHNQPEKIARIAETRPLHTVHVTTHPIGCTRCHTEIKHRLPPPIGAPIGAGLSVASPVASSRRP